MDWSEDLFYSTSVPSPRPVALENSPSPAVPPRFTQSASSPSGVVRTRRRRPLSDLKERSEGLTYTEPVVRRLQFDL